MMMNELTGLSALEFDVVAENGSLASKELVEAVIGACLMPQFFDRAIVLRSPFLRNRPLLKLLGDQPFCVVSDGAAVAASDWVKGCHSQGHLSVWFLPKEWSDLEAEIGQRVRLGQGREVRVGGDGGADPMGKGQRASFESLLESGELHGSAVALCFSHDGAQLFRVALGVE